MDDVAERFHVVNDGGAHVEAHRCREVRRLDSWVGSFALERFDQAGFLAANVSRSPAMDVDFEVETGAKDVFAQKALFFGVRDRFFQDDGRFGEFLADINVGGVSADRVGRDDHALDQLVWILVNDVAVLEGAGLRLVTVADQVNWLGVAGRNEAPLDASWETRAAAAS